MCWFNTKFFKLTLQILYNRQLGEFVMRSWEGLSVNRLDWSILERSYNYTSLLTIVVRK